MVRTIAGAILAVVSGVRLLLGPNPLGILDWVVLSCALIVVVHLMYDVVRSLDPARRFFKRSRQEHDDKTLREIRNLQRSPFFTPMIDGSNPYDGVITAGIGIKPTWNSRVFKVVLWLANRSMLPRKLTIMIGERLGWEYRWRMTNPPAGSRSTS